MAPANMTDEEKETVAKQTILGRWGGAEDIANAAAFLLENDFINGTVLVVDGGRSLV
jgi:3-oxoacyl-[acyl-carrier protein] reductase